MPIYEYHCKACGHNMEEMQKISEAPLKDCPVCKQAQLEKLVSAAGFQLKGSGWYKTDYSSKDKGKEKKTESKAESKTTTTKDKTDSSSSSGAGEKT